jgi:hypothetical protein
LSDEKLSNHAALEDTIIFPAWKQTMTGKELDEMNDKYEDIEHDQFGEDGLKMPSSKSTQSRAVSGLPIALSSPRPLTKGVRHSGG